MIRWHRIDFGIRLTKVHLLIFALGCYQALIRDVCGLGGIDIPPRKGNHRCLSVRSKIVPSLSVILNPLAFCRAEYLFLQDFTVKHRTNAVQPDRPQENAKAFKLLDLAFASLLSNCTAGA
jgi:hypothetical protein